MKQAEEEEFEVKAVPSNIGIRKRKRLQSVRVRNALRSSNRGKEKNTHISSTSDDSTDNVICDPKRRRASKLFSHSKGEDTQSNNNNDGEIKIKDPPEMRTRKFETLTFAKMPINDRLNYCEQSDGSQYLDCEDLSENSDLLSQEKSGSNSSTCKLNADEESITSGRTFQCPLCVAKSFRQVNLLIRHLLCGHNLDLNDTDLNNLKYLILHKQKEISQTVTPPQFSRPFTLARCKARRKSIEKRSGPTPVILECQLEEQEIEWNSKARIDGRFTCLKCNFNFGDEQRFYEHIKNDHVWTDEEKHRLKENGAEYEPILEFWCPECDNTFVTKSALCMHIKGNHGDFLNDVELYLEQIGYDGEIPMAENQCNICYIVEDGPKEFEKHVRQHGLAFLRRQQLLSKLRTLN